MTEFGPNGSVTSGGGSAAYAYSSPVSGKVQRVGLAVFLCGLCACFAVALIGFLFFFMFEILNGLTGANIEFNDGFFGGFRLATMLAMMNWFLFFINIPVACLVLGLSVGRMPRRGITGRRPYLKWSIIWGIILVAGTTTLFAATEGLATAAGGLLAGTMIGALAGLACGALFLAIVRPNTQLSSHTIDTF